VEPINPAFDANKVLLRRVCFINNEKSKYVSVGFYPAKNYQPLVEFGGAKILPITLAEQHVKTMAENLPRLCNALCDG
jgi:hypothetical protein